MNIINNVISAFLIFGASSLHALAVSTEYVCYVDFATSDSLHGNYRVRGGNLVDTAIPTNGTILVHRGFCHTVSIWFRNDELTLVENTGTPHNGDCRYTPVTSQSVLARATPGQRQVEYNNNGDRVICLNVNHSDIN